MSELANFETGEITTNEQPGTLTALPMGDGTVQLAEWAQELNAAHQLGTALCKTDFVPKEFKGKPEAAAAAILAGKALGLDPMNALSNIFVIHGKPGMYARTMAALVMQAGHHIRRTVATDDQVTVMARRKGDDEWQEFTWTIGRATKAGYTSNAKYKSDPIAMLGAKALAEACRTIAPDVLTGVSAYAVEELELEGKPVARPRRTPQPVELEEVTEPEAPAITEQQWAELVAAAEAVGKTPADIAGAAAELVGHELRGWQEIPANVYDELIGRVSVA